CLCWLSYASEVTPQTSSKDFSELVRRGQTRVVWAKMCKALWCNYSVCLTIQTDGQPARVLVSGSATWPNSDIRADEHTGRYCSPSKSMTYFMTYTLSVQALDGDVLVTWRGWDD